MMGDNFDMLRRALELPVDADLETVCGFALARIEDLAAELDDHARLLDDYRTFVEEVREALYKCES